MKKAMIVLITGLFFTACTPDEIIEPAKGQRYIQTEGSAGGVNVLSLEENGCTYVVITTTRGAGIVHAANCKNPDHK